MFEFCSFENFMDLLSTHCLHSSKTYEFTSLCTIQRNYLRNLLEDLVSPCNSTLPPFLFIVRFLCVCALKFRIVVRIGSANKGTKAVLVYSCYTSDYFLGKKRFIIHLCILCVAVDWFDRHNCENVMVIFTIHATLGSAEGCLLLKQQQHP